MSITRLYGLFFFEEINATTGRRTPVTINAECCLQMLELYFISQLQQDDIINAAVFMQDGATPHTSNQS